MALPEYNTNKKNIKLREYGRNIQMICNVIMKEEDPEQKKQMAYTLIELMKQINPATKEYQEYSQKVWDHLYIISDFKLEVDSPYEKPERSILDSKPGKVPYNSNELHYKHYGQNIELFIEKAKEKTEPEERLAAVVHVGKLMKRFYSHWNNEIVDDAVILGHIKELSDNELDIDLELVRENKLFDSNTRDYSSSRNDNNSSSSSSSGRKSYAGKGKGRKRKNYR